MCVCVVCVFVFFFFFWGGVLSGFKRDPLEFGPASPWEILLGIWFRGVGSIGFGIDVAGNPGFFSF